MGAPGSDIDDGFALALALADPDIDLELVTTVGGNSDVDCRIGVAVDVEGFGSWFRDHLAGR